MSPLLRPASLLLSILAVGPILAASPGAGAASPVSAGDCYNAGTIALERGDLGASVTLLLAASRLDPRASDVRANLRAAASQVARQRGDDERAAGADALPFPVSGAEGWWLAAAALSAGSALGIAARRGRRRGPRWTAIALAGVGIALSAWLHGVAWREARHPEAVVVVPSLSVERGPDEPSRPAVLLSAGERVRLGRSRGELIEIRFGGNPIGWAPRSGLWRVIDAPRYTGRFPSS